MTVSRRWCGPILRCEQALLVLVAAVAPVAGQAAGEAGVLAPEGEEARVAASILDALEHRHYRDLEVDDAFSESVLGRYLDALDPSRATFLAGDVAEFRERYGDRLDDALLGGDLHPAFDVFNRYRRRLLTQTRYYQHALEAGLAALRFDVPEVLELDRSEAPWPATEEAAREIWRRRFKNDVLSLRLGGSADESIVDTLTRRYANRAHRIEQTEARDVFNLFMNVVSGAFDPHTNYFPPQEAENFDMQMSLSFQGIGAELTTDGEFATVARLIPGGPAERSGQVVPTDRIVAVGQEGGELVDVVGERLDDIVALIRGPAGTHVRLALRSAEAVDGARVVDLERDEVQLEEQAASSQVIELEAGGRTWKIGLIDLPAFYVDFAAAQAGEADYRSSTRDVARAIRELQGQGIDGIVMDLRGNGGGSLTEAESMCGLFLGPGPVVQVRDAAGRVQVLGTRERALYEGPLVVLIDRLSASASEIFAAAIQDRGRGLLVGTRTFGKGTVQAILPLAEGQLKLTQAKFYRVSGGSTQHRGVTPDIELPSRFDQEEVGESALPSALPWDRIRPAIEPTPNWLQRSLPTLVERHRERVAADPDFLREADEYAALDEMRGRRTVSLVEADRRAQAARDEARMLAIENRWRAAHDLAPVEDLEESRADAPAEEVDAFAREAARILLDARSLRRVVRR